MPSERTNSLQTAFCRQTDLLKPTFFIISDKLLCKNPKIQNHRKLSKKQKPSAVVPAKAEIQTRKPQKFIGKTETRKQRTEFPPAQE
ncbi:hypothetical protein EGO73_06015 [Neisseria gonorrhoeae]|nr:hypothetical protein EGO73_06015 [Neisseria gonorrhoeae]